MLSVKNLVKIYQQKKAEPVRALNGVTIDFPETGLVFLLGKSGSGKSTLLNAIGGLDTFDEGEIIIKGKSSKEFSQSDFDSYRNTFIGFIFQEYNILENFTVEKNLALAIELQGKKPNKEEIHSLLEQVDMLQYAKRKPNQLSGGQKQRVAIARALVKHPEIIMADEPTGALDSNTGKQVMETLKKLSKEKLVIIVSHDREFAEFYGDRIVELKDGKIISDVTKKEIQAEETASGIKLIDNSIVYIKKGQEVSEAELKKLAKIINDNAKKTDTIISFDSDANKKFKESASITDDGNREKFEKTTEEDVPLKNYNGKSLKLIKSRLKFSDSFKMGASSLKNKVGKLFFTILLSFLAFTVFGVVDALSCWNRGASVYDAMKLTNQTNIVMKGAEKGTMYPREAPIREADLKALREKFPDYMVKGVVSTNYDSVYVNNYNMAESRNPLYQTQISGFLALSQEELNKMGFTIEGRLPQTEDEICISKLMMESIMKRATRYDDETDKIESFSEFSDSNPLLVSKFSTLSGKVSANNYNGFLRVVGVIDDKTDISKYTSMDQDELVNDRTAEQYFQNTFMRFVYVQENLYETLLENSYVDTYYYGWISGVDSDYVYINNDYFGKANESFNYAYLEQLRNQNSMWVKNWNASTFEDMFYTEQEMANMGYMGYSWYDVNYQDILTSKIKYIKGGDLSSRIVNQKLVLAEDEILLRESDLNNMFDDYTAKIEEGLTITLTTDYDEHTNGVKTFKVVGTVESIYNGDNWVEFLVKDEIYSDMMDELYGGYELAVSKLNGTSTDEAFVEYLETWNDDNFRMSVQTSSTYYLDMLEEILMMMTTIFVWVAVGFAVFASLLLMNFISTSINYKKREIGVLRALGARGSDIFGIFFNESTVIAFINFVLASIATIAACIVINSVMIAKLGIEIALLNVGIRQVVLILAISWGAAFLASLLPSLKISRKKPIDAINNR